VLTLLKPPSPASSAGPREVTVTPLRPLQATLQWAGPLSIVSPPGSSSPTKPLDTPRSTKGISVLKRWFPGRFKKTTRNQGSQPPDRSATAWAGRPLDLGPNSQSRSRDNTPQKGPPTMAAGRRSRVSVLFTVGKMVVVYLTSHLRERSGNTPNRFVF